MKQTNTSCKLCIFSEKAGGQNSCSFDIIEHIKDIKTIDIKEEYNYIHDYACRYSLSKEAAENTGIKQLDDLKSHLVQRAFIKYYLIVDIRKITTDIDVLIEEINNLDIQPKFVSFISSSSMPAKNIFDKLTTQLKPGIKWKLHNFIIDIELEKILNVVIDTNSGANGSFLFLVHEPSEIIKGAINDKVNYIHFKIMVEQIFVHGFCDSYDTINWLCLPFMAFKELYNCETKSIMGSLKHHQTLTIKNYETT